MGLIRYSLPLQLLFQLLLSPAAPVVLLVLVLAVAGVLVPSQQAKAREILRTIETQKSREENIEFLTFAETAQRNALLQMKEMLEEGVTPEELLEDITIELEETRDETYQDAGPAFLGCDETPADSSTATVTRNLDAAFSAAILSSQQTPKNFPAPGPKLQQLTKAFGQYN